MDLGRTPCARIFKRNLGRQSGKKFGVGAIHGRVEEEVEDGSSDAGHVALELRFQIAWVQSLHGSPVSLDEPADKGRLAHTTLRTPSAWCRLASSLLYSTLPALLTPYLYQADLSSL